MIHFRVFIFSIFLLCIPAITLANEITNTTKGKILLQVEEHGEAWYVNPSDGLRYYLGRPADAFRVMQFLGVGISNAQLEEIPTSSDSWKANRSLMNSVRGKILLQVEEHGEAWYVNPVDEKRYYLGRPDDAFRLMVDFGLGIRTEDLFAISSQVRILSVQAKGENDPLDEFVLVQNVGQFKKRVSRWFITDDRAHTLTFPKNTVLQPGESIRIHTPEPDPIWDDRSGIAKLYGPKGTLIDSYTYNNASTVVLHVPFTVQAPVGNWSSPFNEACEESILVMLRHFFDGKSIDPNEANQEILDIVDWEKRTYGFHEDTSAEVTARTAREYMNFSATVSSDVTKEEMKNILSQGKPIILPVYGKALKNPHYKNGGPYYHMIVVVGYEGDEFITHDPGTRYGEQYRYNADLLLNAIHDLTAPETLAAQGKPGMVIVEK